MCPVIKFRNSSVYRMQEFIHKKKRVVTVSINFNRISPPTKAVRFVRSPRCPCVLVRRSSPLFITILSIKVVLMKNTTVTKFLHWVCPVHKILWMAATRTPFSLASWNNMYQGYRKVCKFSPYLLGIIKENSEQFHAKSRFLGWSLEMEPIGYKSKV